MPDDARRDSVSGLSTQAQFRFPVGSFRGLWGQEVILAGSRAMSCKAASSWGHETDSSLEEKRQIHHRATSLAEAGAFGM